MGKNHLRQNLFALLAAIIWGSAFVAQSVGAEHMDALAFNAIRSLTAFIFLLTLCAIRRLWFRPAAAPWKKLLTAGVCCGLPLTLASFLQQTGMETTSSGRAGFITALYIVIVPLFSIVLHKKPAAVIWLSVALAVVGLYFLCVNETFAITGGDLCVLLCAVCFAVQILVIDHFTQMVDGVELSCAQFLVVSLLSGLGAAFAEAPPSREALALSVLPILYTGIFSSGIAYTLQILAQKDSNPTVISLLMSTEAVFATLSGAVLLQERMTLREGFGCALMLCAVIIVQLSAGDGGGKSAVPEASS